MKFIAFCLISYETNGICHIRLQSRQSDNISHTDGRIHTSYSHTSFLKTQHYFNGCLLFCNNHPDSKDWLLSAEYLLFSFCRLSLYFSVSKLLPTHSLSLSLPLAHTHTDIAEHHTLLAGYLLQMRRGGLRWWLPQPPLTMSFASSLSLPLSPLTVNWWAMLKDALFLLRWPGKRCSAATNKRPYARLVTSSEAAFNSITPALCLNKGSAIAADLTRAGDKDGVEVE